MTRFLGVCALFGVYLLALGPAGAGGDKDKKVEGKKIDSAAIFQRLDTNGDGKLTRDEFLQIAEKLKEKLGEEKGEKLKTFLEKAFDKMDAKKAGFLTLEQFKSFNLRELLAKRKQAKD